MFNPRTFENSRPDGFPVLEIVGSGDGDAQPGEPARGFVPLARTDLIGEVAGPVALLHLSQRFRFSAAQHAGPIEAVYRFPLPGDAAVTGVTARFGEVEIQAELAERSRAEQTYQEARDEGRQAALVTREAPDVFTLQVTGLKPDEDVTVQTSYAQLARPEGERWTLRVPLTTVPRFVRSDEQDSRHAEGQPLAVLRDPGHRFTLDLTVEAAERMTSSTHVLEAVESEGRVRVRLRDGEVLPDRDCLLAWQPRRAADRPTLQLLHHDDPATGDHHFLALVTPPAATATQPLAREVILLIDHSGSMSGPKWEAADWAVQNLLAGLGASDTFNLGLFHTTTRWFARQPVRGDERTVRQASDFLFRHKDSGGTELGVALEQSLEQPRDTGQRARHVLIVTDAQVSDAGRILSLVEREAGRADRRRVDVLCIDAAPNSGLANELAERGGGIARFLTSDPAENDIASALDEVLADWAAPLLRNLTLWVDSATVQAAGRRLTEDGQGRCGIDLGDVSAGRAVWVAGRIASAGGSARAGSPDFRLLADGVEIAAEGGAPESGAAQSPAVAALFGARRVLDLELAQSSGADPVERLRQLGYDPNVVLGTATGSGTGSVYPENARRHSTEALHDLLVRESLRYGIACSETAFVATRREAGQKVTETVAVGNALAHGWSSDFAMARMALSAAPMAFSAMAPPPMPAPMPTSAPPPQAGGPPEWGRFSRALRETAPDLPTQAPGSPAPGAGAGGGAGGGSGLRSLADSPFDLARGLARRLRGGRPERGERSEERSAGSGLVAVFSGTPAVSGGEAVLFDSRQAAGQLPERATLTRLALRLGAGAAPGAIDPGLVIALYVDDLAAPRARVRLADLIRQGGERPLNVRWRPGQVVRVVLLDPNGAWAVGAPHVEVALG